MSKEGLLKATQATSRWTTPSIPSISSRRSPLFRFLLRSIFAFLITICFYYASHHYLPSPSLLRTHFSDLFTPAFNPQEIADLMAQYYESLAEMHYYPRSYIKYPPHSPPISLDLCKKYNLEPQVVELLQSLPYIEGYSNEDEFILYGSFADYRDESVFEQARDPTFASPEGDWNDENGPYMRPWVVALTECGNHGTVVYLDTHSGKISMAGQLDDSSSDPAFEGYQPEKHSKNRNSIDHLPSRSAKQVLEDFMNRHRNLEWIPYKQNGYPYISREYVGEPNSEHAELKLLFQTYGWPTNFSGAAFDAASERLEGFRGIRDTVRGFEGRLKDLKDNLNLMNEYLKEFIARFEPRTKVWDNDPNKTPEEIHLLEKQMESYATGPNRVRGEIEQLELILGNWEGDEREISKAWERELKRQMERIEMDLSWSKTQKDAHHGHLEQEEVLEKEAEIGRLRERLNRWEEEPRTAWEAIKPG